MEGRAGGQYRHSHLVGQAGTGPGVPGPDQGTDLQAVLGQIEANRDRIQAAIEGDPGPQASNGDQATRFKIPPN